MHLGKRSANILDIWLKRIRGLIGRIIWWPHLPHYASDKGASYSLTEAILCQLITHPSVRD